MASNKDITLRQGHATPKTIVLQSLAGLTPIQTTIYLYGFDATAKNVVLRDPTLAPVTSGDRSVSAAQTLATLTHTTSIVALETVTAAQTLGDLTQAGAVAAVLSASASQTLGDLTQAANLAALEAISAAQTLDTITQDATLTVTSATLSISAAQALDDLIQAASLAALGALSAAQSLGDITQTSTFATLEAITAAQALSDATQSATAAVIEAITTAQTLAEATQTAAMTVDVAVAATQTLETLSQAATLAGLVALSAAQSLGDVGQDATLTTDSALSLAANQMLDSLMQDASLSQAVAVFIMEGTNRSAGGPKATRIKGGRKQARKPKRTKAQEAEDQVQADLARARAEGRLRRVDDRALWDGGGIDFDADLDFEDEDTAWALPPSPITKTGVSAFSRPQVPQATQTAIIELLAKYRTVADHETQATLDTARKTGLATDKKLSTIAQKRAEADEEDVLELLLLAS